MLRIQNINRLVIKRRKADKGQLFMSHDIMIKSNGEDKYDGNKHSVMRLHHPAFTYNFDEKNVLQNIPGIRVTGKYAELDGCFFYTEVPKEDSGHRYFNNFSAGSDYTSLKDVEGINMTFGSAYGEFDIDTVMANYDTGFKDIDTVFVAIPFNGCITNAEITTDVLSDLDASLVYVVNNESSKPYKHSMFTKKGDTEMQWESTKSMNVVARIKGVSKYPEKYSFTLHYSTAVRDVKRQVDTNENSGDPITIRKFMATITVNKDRIIVQQRILSTEKIFGAFEDYVKPVAQIYDRVHLEEYTYPVTPRVKKEYPYPKKNNNITIKQSVRK